MIQANTLTIEVQDRNGTMHKLVLGSTCPVLMEELCDSGLKSVSEAIGKTGHELVRAFRTEMMEVEVALH